MRMMTQPPLKQNPVAHATIGVSPEQALTPARPLDGNLAIDHDGLDASAITAATMRGYRSAQL
jgi:hypothetical protein